MMNLVELAKKLRPLIEHAASSLSDQDASAGAQLFPGMKLNGNLIKAGTRINWKGTIKKAAVDLWDTTENTPEKAPTLWEDIAYINGFRIAPEVFTATNAADMGECLWFDGTLYKSLKAGNVHTPAQAPGAWEIVEV